jgi:carboxyl-terminal processing protease
MTRRLLVGLALFLCASRLGAGPLSEAEESRAVIATVQAFDEQGIYAPAPLDARKCSDLFWKRIADYRPVDEKQRVASLAVFQESEVELRRGQVGFARRLVGDAPVDEAILLSALLNSWLLARDPYASWQTAGDNRQWETYLSGKLHGIGVRWAAERSRGGGLAVTAVVPGGPAEQAGVRAGLKIGGVEIDGHPVDLSTTRTEDLAPRIGSAQVVVLHAAPGEDYRVVPRDIVLEQEQIRLDEEQGVPRLRVPHFDRGAALAIAGLLGKVPPASPLILDLRECGGGYTDEAIALVGLLEGPGQIGVEWFYRDEVGRTRHRPVATEEARAWEGDRLTILVDAQTASAAELVVMALRDRPGVAVKGGPTYGKTTSQDLVPVLPGGTLRVSVARFSPSGGEK